MPESDKYRQYSADLVKRVGDLDWRVSSLERAILLSSLPVLPAGAMTLFGGPTAGIPSGWLVCDGSAVNRITYAKLFAAIGTTWGAGDGSTTFNLPNFTDRFPVGVGSNAVGAVGGSGNTSAGTSHTHSSASTDSGGSHSHSIPQGTDQTSSVGGTAVFTVSHQSHTHGGTNSGGSHTHAVSGSTGAEASHFHTNNVPFGAVYYIIRY